MNKRHYEHTLPNIRGSLSNTYERHQMSSDVRKGASKQVGNTRTAGKKEYGQARGRTAGKRTNGVHGTEEKRSGYSGPCRTEGAEAPCFFLWSVIYL